MTVHGFDHHDHESCVADALSAAESYCETHKLKFTKVRRRVLEILLSEHKAMGAYDVLAILGQEGLGAQPPVAYRALDFLVSNGFAHKVEKLNAYVACARPGEEHSPVFMICRSCDAVAEAGGKPDQDSIGATAKDLGFKVETTVVEAEGLCPDCQPVDAAR